ncbi:MAG: alpha/beta hydrolase, partial [Bacteroidetes bacterium]|nr:alpha/beta hydrolase [Bacteroidota bacterium]
MKFLKTICPTALLLAFFTQFAFGQTGVTGDWHGVLDIKGTMKLRIVFHVQKTDSGFSATLDSPDQSAFGLPAGGTSFTPPTLTIDMPALGAKFSGEANENFTEINGTFEQSGLKMPLLLNRQ